MTNSKSQPVATPTPSTESFLSGSLLMGGIEKVGTMQHEALDDMHRSIHILSNMNELVPEQLSLNNRIRGINNRNNTGDRRDNKEFTMNQLTGGEKHLECKFLGIPFNPNATRGRVGEVVVGVFMGKKSEILGDWCQDQRLDLEGGQGRGTFHLNTNTGKVKPRLCCREGIHGQWDSHAAVNLRNAFRCPAGKRQGFPKKNQGPPVQAMSKSSGDVNFKRKKPSSRVRRERAPFKDQVLLMTESKAS
ncbi:hypothetical protein M5K25_024255 [Dendrobium thyrsiflorum]|uniref:Uncharacterized protein n=1 Tax=Dendrobium thyrsiflorum TaxID=117978 RepID=A0ABD0U1P5_DENTH